MTSERSAAIILNCFDSQETETSPILVWPVSTWLDGVNVSQATNLWFDVVAFMYPDYSPKDIAVRLLHGMQAKTLDLSLPIPERNGTIEELIESVESCLLWCTTKAPVLVHFHGLSTYEDNIENIKGLLLLQHAVLKLAANSTTHYPLKVVISNTAPSKIVKQLIVKHPGVPVVDVPTIEEWERDHPEDFAVPPPVPPKSPLREG